MDLLTGVSDDVWDLSASVLGIDRQPANLAHALVLSVELNLLRGDWPAGYPLGALSPAREALGLGRPAFREAIIILQTRGLLDVKRGPGGGIFVGIPCLENAVAAALLYLSACGATQDCVLQFRLAVWKMIAEVAVRHGVCLANSGHASDEAFAVRLARQVGNPAMVVAASLAEMLAQVCDGAHACAHDMLLDEALQLGELAPVLRRLEELAGPTGSASPIAASDKLEARLADLNCNVALTLAARMLRELRCAPHLPEAEWETAERLGYTPGTVRQARRVLQDLGVIRCRQGRRGAMTDAPADPASVIRLLAACLVASGMTERDNREAAYYLACSAPALAARRDARKRAEPIARSVPSACADLPGILRFENFLLDRCGNPLLGIVVRSLGLVGISASELPLPACDGGEVAALNDRILLAIESGDSDAAGALARVKASAMPQIGRPLAGRTERALAN